jgi:superfamily II DNA or RNA helicase
VGLDSLLASLRPGGRDFERICKWALENVPEYRQRLRKVWLWDEWPGRWGRDAGIDLVAEDAEGGLWAVQAKHYDPAYAIKKADLDSFLSESSRPGFTYRLVVATTDHLGPTARRTLDAQEKPVGTLLRSQLDALDVQWPSSAARLRPARPVRKRPRPHQRRAVADCVTGLAATDRGQLVMACGTGKTLVAPFLTDRMGAKRVLVLVPSLSLLGQTLREWASATGFDYLAVCSDETVTRDEQDAVVASTSELGIPVTTDPERIARFLRRRREETMVVFSTYQSSPQIAAAQAGRVPAFDLVVADEAHRCAGPQAGVFATVLDAAKIKARKRLFMTATPRYFTGRVKREASEADWEVASMDEEAQFGPVFHRLTFGQAIDQELLADYRVVVVGVTDSEALDLASRGAFVTHDGQAVTDARTLARQIGLLRAMAKHDLRRIVTFHSRIEYATRFASSLPGTSAWLPARRRPSGRLWTDHVSGKMTAGERDARLRRLRGVGSDERGVLTNARCLTEGVDVPTLDGVAFIDPRRSQVDVVQAVGRAIRKAEDKALGYIVVPVLVDADSDPGEAIEASEFDRVWEVLRGLRDHDDDLADELDALRRQQGRLGSLGERPGKIVLDVPLRLGRAFAHAFDSKLVETTTTSWEFWFGLLQRFIAREGSAEIRKSHVEGGYRLGGWVANQRRKYAAGRLSADRSERLKELSGWSWDTHVDAWEDGYSALQRFVGREGHALVPSEHVEGTYPLGQWVVVQRIRWQRGRLPEVRAARLDVLAGWSWDPVDDAWEEHYGALQHFVAREGHARVSYRQMEDGYKLGQWVTVQRRSYGAEKLSHDRAAHLAALPGWAWGANEADWERGFSYLARFVAREGDARVPQTHVEDGYFLGRWVSKQRSRRAELHPDRVARLEALPAWTWHPHEATWEEGYSLLQRFIEREGHARIPRSYSEDGFALGRWIDKNRARQRARQLDPDRIARLEALPGWLWSPYEADWEEAFQHLVRYVEREGHARVPRSHVVDGFRLGAWVGNNRSAFKGGRLSPERTQRLQALDGWAWNTRDDNL